MTTDARFTRVEFRNFKAFSRFSLALSEMNILVGPNNSGKSTVIGAFRALWSALRRARTKRAEMLNRQGTSRLGYSLSEDAIPISLENVHTDYSEEDTHIVFSLSNGNRLTLLFPANGGALLFPDTQSETPRTPTQFHRAFPISVAVVPVLGPVEHNEEFVLRETVLRELSTHRAARHFRSYWHYFPDGFADFAELVSKSWPGMEISLPDRPDFMAKTISMFCLEKRIARELYWSGFGFQIWCQLLTHISRAHDSSIIVIDEPEIYLHPDVQRQLLSILRDCGPDVLMATHSTEIISEADPAEILLVDKSERSAKRLADLEQVQQALNLIGSIQNISLTKLAKNRRVVFVEDEEDFCIVRRFAKLLGFSHLSTGVGLTPFKSEGFSSWDRIRSVGWGIEKTLGTQLQLAVIYDRDYRSDEEIDEIRFKLEQHIPLVHFHRRKEIENFLLDPRIVERAIASAVQERCRRTGEDPPEIAPVVHLLEAASRDLKSRTISQYAARRSEYLRHCGTDSATIIQQTTEVVEGHWIGMETRMKIVSGKEVLKRLRESVRQQYKVNLTDFRLVDSYRRDEVPQDLVELVQRLDTFRARE